MNKNFINTIRETDSCYKIAEIGINHNGDIDLAKKLIKTAYDKGFDAAKFQKRVPELCVPQNKRNEPRLTPWGQMTYFEYKQKIEFGKEEYDQIDDYCNKLGIDWSASAWDLESIEFLKNYDIPFIKIPSDKANDIEFVRSVNKTGIPVILSTGGTDLDQLSITVKELDSDKLSLLQCTSIYPCPTELINMSVMTTLKEEFKVPVGFSSHHTSPLVAAMSVPYGARIIEVHITLDRAMWGTDHPMSLEPRGMEILTSAIKDFELAKGSPNKVVLEKETKTLARTVGRSLEKD